MSSTIFVENPKNRLRIRLIVLFALLCLICPPRSSGHPARPGVGMDRHHERHHNCGQDKSAGHSGQVALVSASVFDAVNGIKARYTPLLVTSGAPRHASQRAAAIQAAYALLIKLYTSPEQVASLTAHRDASIAAIGSAESAKSI